LEGEKGEKQANLRKKEFGEIFLWFFLLERGVLCCMMLI